MVPERLSNTGLYDAKPEDNGDTVLDSIHAFFPAIEMT